MKLVDVLLRIYSVGFVGILCLFFLAVGLLAKLSGTTLDFSMLPWTGESLVNWILLLSIVGLVAAGLAAVGRLKWLFALFALYVFGQVVYGYYIGPHRFDGYDDFTNSLLLAFGAFLAALGAIRGALRRA